MTLHDMSFYGMAFQDMTFQDITFLVMIRNFMQNKLDLKFSTLNKDCADNYRIYIRSPDQATSCE